MIDCEMFIITSIVDHCVKFCAFVLAELVELYLGICGPFKLSFRTRIGWARDSSSVLRRWGGSLLSLDLTGQAVTDAEVVEIIHLGRGSNLRHLALGGTQITEHILGYGLVTHFHCVHVFSFFFHLHERLQVLQ